jgi:4-oxalocrotonate tautomerase
MPIIHVELFEGRTLDQKREFAKAVTDAVVKILGSSADHTDVIFTDTKKSDWATGGKLASD